VVYTEAPGPAAYIGRARVVPWRNRRGHFAVQRLFDFAGDRDPALRMDRITDNALKVARFLSDHAKVRWVNYAGLEQHRDHAPALGYLGGKPSGVLTFGVEGGVEGGARFQALAAV
jgi:O-acetylhomoserine (thiol)-lyase